MMTMTMLINVSIIVIKVSKTLTKTTIITRIIMVEKILIRTCE